MVVNFLHKITLLFYFLLLPSYFFGQNIKFLPLTKLNTKELIPSLNARKILKDKFGYIWIATQDGVYRFDGSNHKLYNNGQRDDRFSLIGTDFFDLGLDEDGENIWALSGIGGLNEIDINTGIVKKSFLLTDTKGTDITAKCLFIHRGRIYVGTSEGLTLLFDIKLNKIINSYSVPRPEHTIPSVENILADKKGNMCFLISGIGIMISDSIFQKREFLRESQLFGKTNVTFTDCALYQDLIILSSSSGIAVVNSDQKKIVNNDQVFPGELTSFLTKSIHCIAVNKDSIFFDGPGMLFIVDVSRKKYTQIIFSSNKDDQKWLVYTSSLLCDNNYLWLGGQYGTAAIKNFETAFTGYFDSMDSSFNKLEHCYQLFHTKDGEFVCSDDGLFIVALNNGIIRKISSSHLYYSGKAISNESFIVSGPDGTELVSLNGTTKKISGVFPELRIIEKESIASIEALNDTVFFFAGFDSKKVYRWNKAKRKVDEIFSLPGTLKGYNLNRLFLDSHKRLWILFDGAVAVYDSQTQKIENLDLRLPGKTNSLRINMDILEMSGNIWIAAYGTGLVELSGNRRIEKIIGLKDGISNAGLYKIYSLDDSLIIASSNEGVTVLNTRNDKVKNYFAEDGLHSNYFEQFSGDKSGDTIFFGGTKGFTMINAKKINLNTTIPQLYITSVQTENGKTTKNVFNLQLQKFTIPSDVIQATVNFTAIDYISPEKDSFSYRILEISKNWLPLGNKRNVNLIGQSPGIYTLQIKNAGIDAATAAPLQLILTFLPKWYQTIWFDIAIALAVFGILYAFYRYRIGQLKKQQEIRVGIASDLHDDIGSALNTVKVFTHLAKRDVQKDEHLNQIEESVTQATIGLRDMIWILDDTQDTLQEIMERIKKFALPVAGANGIALDCITETAEGENRVNKTKKRNLLLIAKESINNSIKYAQCKNIQVLLQQKKNKITLIIKDDGIGFDADTVAKGYGLKNIQQRAKQMNCTAEISSAAGEGTIIKVMSKG